MVIIIDSSLNGGNIDRNEKRKNYKIHLKFVSTYTKAKTGGDRSVCSPFYRRDSSVIYFYISETKCKN